jgi:hypothetical protein
MSSDRALREGKDGKENLTSVPRFSFISNTEMAETTFDPERDEALSYALYTAEGTVTTEDCLVRGTKKFTPPGDHNDLIAKGLVLFPSAAVDYGTQEDLGADLRAFIRRYSDVPPFWEELMAEFAKLTWVYDRFNAIPYLRFLGDFQSGKTRMAQTVAHLCYRTIIGGGATTSAPFFRLLEHFRGTFFLDESDYRSSDLWSDIIKILNGGYKKGLPVWRCDKDNRPEAFDCYCPKILTTRKRFEDLALESRCLTLETHEGEIREDITRQLPDAFYQEAERLRNRLLMWRFRTYRQIALDQSKLLSLDPRMTEIIVPLVAVSSNPGFRSRLVEFCGACAAEQRAERPQALIFEAIRQLAGSTNGKVLFVKDVAQKASDLRQDQEPEAAKQARTADGDEPQFFTAKRAGSLVRSLGFETRRTANGYQFEVEKAKMAALEKRYQ